jgi:predicted transcriptional regulator
MAMQHHYDERANGLIINIVPELRRRIQIAAEQSNLSMQEYVEHILEQTVPPEPLSMQIPGKGLNRTAIDDLLRYREEVKRAHPGQISEDSSELLHQAREERMRELEQQ